MSNPNPRWNAANGEISGPASVEKSTAGGGGGGGGGLASRRLHCRGTDANPDLSKFPSFEHGVGQKSTAAKALAQGPVRLGWTCLEHTIQVLPA